MSEYMSDGEAMARDEAFLKALHELPLHALVRMYVVGEVHPSGPDTKTYVIMNLRGSIQHFYWYDGTWHPCEEGVAFNSIKPAWTSDE